MRDNTPLVVFAEKQLHPFYLSALSYKPPIHIYSCEDGLNWIASGSASLIIIDCGLRTEDGLKLLSEIKKRSVQTIGLFVAEVSSEETVINAFNAGARAYLKKPFDVSVLKFFIKKFLSFKNIQLEEDCVSLEGRTILSKTVAFEQNASKPSNLLRAFWYMEQNLETKIDLKACANEAAVSKYHFSRVFKRYFGMPPIQFIKFLRVNRAKELLNRNDLNIGEIAFMVGFNDEDSFTRAFKKYTGITPSLYRDSLRKVI